MRRFQQVDVFGAEPFLGNPVAVVLDGEGLSDAQMQRMARWTNLSETTFVLPPTDPSAHYRVRIFTPTQELPFAGHPTLGSCHAWLDSGGATAAEIVQECAAGLVRIRRGEHLAFEAPPLVRSGPVAEPDRSRVLSALRVTADEALDMQWVDNGPGWVAVRLADDRAVLALDPVDLDGYFIGAVGPGPDHLEVRAFFDVDGVCVEDPVTGSLNASVARWLTDSGTVDFPYTARQGGAVGRDGRIHVSLDSEGSVWVAGRTVTCVRGELAL